MLGPINIVSFDQGRGVWREDREAVRSPAPDRRWVSRIALAAAALFMSSPPATGPAPAPAADIPVDVR